ncbi:MAG: glycerol-3-phosphate 1-O-acyltransferase PlsY [Verrucomicrobiaceae bacterium]
MIWLLPFIGFLLGSIPFGLLLGKLKGIDIRQHGSGNIGATNVFRTLGKGQGILCLVLDFLKGFIPVVVALNISRIGGEPVALPLGFLDQWSAGFTDDQRLISQIIPVLTAFASIMGHNYSPWIGFKGGKGIATTGGALAGLMPMGVVVLIIVWAIFAFSTRYVSVGSIAAAIALPLITLWGSFHHGKIADGTWNKPLFTLALVAGILAVFKHRANITRLRAGTENKMGAKKKGVTQ